MQCSFGKDEDEFWSNVFPSPVVDRFQADIKRFGKVLNIIKTFEPVFALMSVQAMLKLFRFSDDFGEVIVFPLVALFFVSRVSARQPRAVKQLLTLLGAHRERATKRPSSPRPSSSESSRILRCAWYISLDLGSCPTSR